MDRQLNHLGIPNHAGQLSLLSFHSR